jgi:hypothetical protein
MTQVKRIKINLNKDFSKVRTGTNLSGTFPIQNGLKEEENSIASGFQFSFRLSHGEGPRKPGDSEIAWDISASGLCH